jgi:hypothetical protein
MVHRAVWDYCALCFPGKAVVRVGLGDTLAKDDG